MQKNSTGSGGHAVPEEPNPEDAFIAPDDPLPERRARSGSGSDTLGEAFISPDDPIPERKIELADAFRPPPGIDPDEEGEVVGMDMEAHLEAQEVVAQGDPHVMELMRSVGKLAEALLRRGEAGLRTTPEMSRFEATLRAYCVGFLAGRRAEEPPTPEMEEALPTDG